MKKKETGFTLIELLAIIVILAIIAVITVPIILNVIDNSRKGAAQDSALGFKDAVQKYYMNELLYDDNTVLPSEYVLVGLLPSDFTVNGEEPTEDSWVQLEKGKVVAYSLKFGDYTVTKYKDSDVVCEKGDVQENEETRAIRLISEVDAYVKAALQANSSLTDETAKTVSEMSGVTTNKPDSGWIHFNKVENNVVVVDYSLTYGDLTANYSSLTDGKYVSTFGDERNKPVIIALGDEVCLTETDCFKVIEINGATATLLANNNINPSTGMQGLNGQTYQVGFSGRNYWGYNVDIYDPSINDASGTNYSVAYHVEQYVSKLQNQGKNVTNGRILKYSEVDTGGIAASYKLSGEDYWLGSADEIGAVRRVDRNGSIGSSVYSVDYSYNGVRPVIYIGISDI